MQPAFLRMKSHDNIIYNIGRASYETLDHRSLALNTRQLNLYEFLCIP